MKTLARLLSCSSSAFVALIAVTLLAPAASSETWIEHHPITATATSEPAPPVKLLASGAAVVLPFFQVDQIVPTGETTLYAVRNNSEQPVTAMFSYYATQGTMPSLVEEHTLEPHAVRTVNLRFVPDLPADADGLARGYVVIRALDPALPPAVLSGDYFRIGPSGAEANGGALIPAQATGCRSWSHRFFSGGDFDGGTHIAFFALDAPPAATTVNGNVYNESGELVSMVTVTSDQTTFEISDTELQLPVTFGSIDWAFQDNAHGTVTTTFTATGLLSVGTEAACVDDASTGPVEGAMLFELPGTFLICQGCGNWQFDMPMGGERQFSKVVIDFDFFVSDWDPNRPNGFHAIFWLNNGNRWQDMMGYLNSRGTQNRTVFQSNGPLGNPIGVELVTTPGVEIGQNYHVHYEYDTLERIVWYEIRTPGGAVRVGDLIPLPPNVGPLNTSHTFLQFGSQPGGSVESLTEGWRWSNLTALFLP